VSVFSLLQNGVNCRFLCVANAILLLDYETSCQVIAEFLYLHDDANRGC
jgi:hypothetical protein